MKPLSIAVVIPSFNDYHFLSRLIDSLFSTRAGVTFWPVVVDDCSTDKQTTDYQYDVLAKYVSVVRGNERIFFTRCCNVGIDYSLKKYNPDMVFLLNSDTYVTDGWGEALVSTHYKFSAGIVGATLLYPDGRIQHAGAYDAGQHYGINKPRINYWSDRIVPWLTGAAMCIHKDTLALTGYLQPGEKKQQYDESDRNFCISARLYYGVEIAVSAGCVIYHDTHAAEAMRRRHGDEQQLFRKTRR